MKKHNIKLVLKNTLTYSIGQILPKIAGFILLPVYTYYLTPKEFGIISSMVVFESVLIVFFTLALEKSVIRLYWDYNSDQERKEFIGTLILAVIIVSIFSTSVLFIFKNHVNMVFKSIQFYPYFMLAIIITLLKSLISIPKVLLVVEKRAFLHSIIILTQYLINACLILWFIIVKDQGPTGYLKGNLFSIIIISPFYLYIIRSYIVLRINKNMLINTLSYSLPIIPTILSSWILNFSDRIFIERYLTLRDVGIYSLSYTISGIIIFFSSAFSLAYEPEYFNLANSNQQERARQKIAYYNRFNINSVIIIAFMISLFSKDLIIYFFNDRYYEAFKIIPFIALAFLISELSIIINGRAFRQSKKMLVSMYYSVFTALINVVLNIFLIPRFGLVGAAYATVTSMFLSFILRYYYTIRNCYFIPIEKFEIISLLFFGSFFVLLLNYIYDLQLIYSLLLKITGTFLVILVFYLKNKSLVKNIIFYS